jgi:hypothetical protein
MGGALVTDSGMKALEPLVHLQTLDLSKMDITAAGLEPLTKLPTLRRVSLWRSVRVDDKAAEYLAQMKTLAVLDLSDTSVTDKLLDQLVAMKQLKTILVAGAKVTPEGVERFRKARPDCRVVWAPKYKEVTSEEDTRLIG